MKINEWLKETYNELGTDRYGSSAYLDVRPRIVCEDGFSMSVQAAFHCYCAPRASLKDGDYYEVEIGFPSNKEDLIMNYISDDSDPTETVYGYVPVELVDQVIEKHGGLKFQYKIQ